MSVQPSRQAPAPPVRRLALVAPLAVFALFVGLVLYGLERDPNRQVRSAMVGKAVPAFELPGYSALHPGLASADLRQGTPVLINLFASWCIPCRIEAPQLDALSRQGAVVHAIAVRDTRENLGAFFGAYGNPFRRIGMDDRGRLSIALGSSGVPETFVVDGRGIIRYQHIGEVRPEHVPMLMKELERAR